MAFEDMPKQAVINELVGRGVTLQLEKVYCGKNGCRRCPHGPYWYAYWSQGGRTRTAYVGKRVQKAVEFAHAVRKVGGRIQVIRVEDVVVDEE